MKRKTKDFILYDYNRNDDLNAILKEYCLSRQNSLEQEFNLPLKANQLSDCLNREKHFTLFSELLKWSIRTAQLKRFTA